MHITSCDKFDCKESCALLVTQPANKAASPCLAFVVLED